MIMKLVDEITEILVWHPEGMKATEIASKLGKTKHTVNKCLYKNTKVFTKDDRFYWTLISTTKAKADWSRAMHEMDTSSDSIPVVDFSAIEEIENTLASYSIFIDD